MDKLQAWVDSLAMPTPRRHVKSIYRRGIGTINEQRKNKRAKKVKNSQIPRRIHETEHNTFGSDSIHPLVGHSPNQKEEPINGAPIIHRRWHLRYSYIGGSTATPNPRPYNPRGKFPKYEYKPSIARQCYEKTMQEIEIL